MKKIIFFCMICVIASTNLMGMMKSEDASEEMIVDTTARAQKRANLAQKEFEDDINKTISSPILRDLFITQWLGEEEKVTFLFMKIQKKKGFFKRRKKYTGMLKPAMADNKRAIEEQVIKKINRRFFFRRYARKYLKLKYKLLCMEKHHEIRDELIELERKVFTALEPLNTPLKNMMAVNNKKFFKSEINKIQPNQIAPLKEKATDIIKKAQSLWQQINSNYQKLTNPTLKKLLSKLQTEVKSKQKSIQETHIKKLPKTIRKNLVKATDIEKTEARKSIYAYITSQFTRDHIIPFLEAFSQLQTLDETFSEIDRKISRDVYLARFSPIEDELADEMIDIKKPKKKKVKKVKKPEKIEEPEEFVEPEEVERLEKIEKPDLSSEALAKEEKIQELKIKLKPYETEWRKLKRQYPDPLDAPPDLQRKRKVLHGIILDILDEIDEVKQP